MIRILKASLKIFRAHLRNHPVAMGIFMFCAFFLIGIELGFFFAAPPAQGWLAQNLQNIKNINSDTYAFAVLGDNKNSHATFPELLREVSLDKELSFAIDLGDMVFDGEMEKYRYFFSQVHKNMKIPLLTAIGNHELHEKGRGLYYELFGPFYYSFKVGRDYFIVIDDADGKALDQWHGFTFMHSFACMALRLRHFF